MFTFTSLSSSSRSAAIRSRIGDTAWQGPHHSAQKSTRTGLSLFRTSWSKSVVFTAVVIEPFRFPSGAAHVRTVRKPWGFPAPDAPRLRRMFAPLPDKPDHTALEEDVLAWWD